MGSRDGSIEEMSMSLRNYARLAALAVLIQFSVTALASEPDAVDPSGTVELSGVLTVEHHFGPPNFGENPKQDKKLTVPILVLDKPISVEKNTDLGFWSTHKNVQSVQLLSTISKIHILRYANKHVTVSGKIFERISGHHFTDVLEDITLIKDDW